MTPIHALDLPRLRDCPSCSDLLETLDRLTPPPPTFLSPPVAPLDSGIITWLTRIISTNLDWLTPEEAESVTHATSQLLSRECGRLAAPDMTRSFEIPMSSSSSSSSEPDSSSSSSSTTTLLIHEPTITADSLGLKTWSTSFLLSRQLLEILPQQLISNQTRVLELGSGTGLLGLAIHRLFQVEVVQLTDYLQEIVDNLDYNISLNRQNHRDSSSKKGTIEANRLDWKTPETSPLDGQVFDLLVASDFMYDPSHASLVVAMLRRFSQLGTLVLAAYPLRSSNLDFVAAFQRSIQGSGIWEKVKHGQGSGYDDWGGTESVTFHWYLLRRIA